MTMTRIYHTWDKWECYPAGFYDNKARDRTLTDDQCRQIYADFLRDSFLFECVLSIIVNSWVNSCEHYLSNENMNRIAWLGQASACHHLGIPSKYRAGFYLLTEDEQLIANNTALAALNMWLVARGEPPLTLDEAQSKTEANLY